MTLIETRTEAPSKPRPRLYKIADTAHLLSVSRSTVDRMIASGALKTVIVREHKRIPATEIDRILEAAR